MSTPLLIQNSSTSVVVYLSSAKTGQPSLGLTHEDVIVGIKKEGGSFVTLPLNDLNFYELSDGFYRLALTPNDTDTLGSLYLSFVGADIKNAMVVCHVAEPVTAPPQPSPGYTPSITTVFGYVYDSAGKPKVSVSVTARNVGRPTLVHPVDQGIVLESGIVHVLTDSSGFFSLPLITGTTVEIAIPSASFRRTILVPAENTNLFDIP